MEEKLDLVPIQINYKYMIPIGRLINYYDNEYEKPKPSENFGILTGGTRIFNYPLNKNFVCHKGYFFNVQYGIPQKSKSTLRLPAMVINGQPFPGPTITFLEKKEWVPTAN